MRKYLFLKFKRDLPFIFIVFFICLWLKVYFYFASITGLDFLLYPTDKLVSLLTNSPSKFIEDAGYFHQDIQMIIGKSCAGINFWILSFMLMTFFMLKYLFKTKHRIIALPLIILTSYIITIYVNAIRIALSVLLQQTADIFMIHRPHLIIHEVFGQGIYLFFLIVIYSGFNFILNVKQKQAISTPKL